MELISKFFFEFKRLRWHFMWQPKWFEVKRWSLADKSSLCYSGIFWFEVGIEKSLHRNHRCCSKVYQLNRKQWKNRIHDSNSFSVFFVGWIFKGFLEEHIKVHTFVDFVSFFSTFSFHELGCHVFFLDIHGEPRQCRLKTAHSSKVRVMSKWWWPMRPGRCHNRTMDQGGSVMGT